MIDFARITIIGGEGGNGSGSFTHIKGKRRGKADGGDGGRGGDVYLKATNDLNTLEPFRYVKEYKAKNGVNGASRRRKGADGEDFVVRVPVGTMVNTSNESNIYDLTQAGQKVLVARGAEGGRGNSHLRDEYGRRPLRGEKGQSGEKVELQLELKLIADVGLIGLPNAGKSTLIAALTSARVKIAPYPFTTLEPNLGILKSSQFTVHPLRKRSEASSSQFKEASVNSEHKTIDQPASLVVADIPGLIEGASEGRGLGHLFLRHIERTKLLVHLIDISSGNDLWQKYRLIRKELSIYSKELTKKKEIIALNKIDLVKKEDVEKTTGQFKLHRKRAVAISSLSKKGLGNFVGEVLKGLAK